MSIASHFQDFSVSQPPAPSDTTSNGDPLEGYETGYKAGWDDAAKAQKDTNTHLGSVLMRNLEQIEFTVTEAQAQLLTSLKPVIDGITEVLLPGLAEEALRALISAELTQVLRNHAAGDIALLISEEDEQSISAFMDTERALAGVTLDVRDTLVGGQAYVTCAGKQRKIDVGQAIADVAKTLNDFINQPELEQAHAG